MRCASGGVRVPTMPRPATRGRRVWGNWLPVSEMDPTLTRSRRWTVSPITRPKRSEISLARASLQTYLPRCRGRSALCVKPNHSRLGGHILSPQQNGDRRQAVPIFFRPRPPGVRACRLELQPQRTGHLSGRLARSLRREICRRAHDSRWETRPRAPHDPPSGWGGRLSATRWTRSTRCLRRIPGHQPERLALPSRMAGLNFLLLDSKAECALSKGRARFGPPRHRASAGFLTLPRARR